uniref:Secreted protein n=1 Tax=Steinernema glaseri TaxID=37863 RepID=A0A1I8A6X7_9BILA
MQCGVAGCIAFVSGHTWTHKSHLFKTAACTVQGSRESVDAMYLTAAQLGPSELGSLGSRKCWTRSARNGDPSLAALQGD